MNQRSELAGGDYHYDIFISYKRGEWSEDWVKQHLLEQLRRWIGEEYSEPKIFIDEGVSPGAEWAKEITCALWRSRILVSVLTGRYFRSKWCRFELEHFYARSALAKQPLVFPLLLAGSTQVPADIKRNQCLDFTRFALTSIPKTTTLFMELESEFKALSLDIIARLKRVPPLSTDWPQPSPPPHDTQDDPPQTIRRKDVAL